VIEWAATLPDTFKYNNGIKKYILREIVHDFIPKELMDRPKMGFAIPIESWLQREFKQHVDYYLQEQRIEQQAIFNVEAIQKLKREFYRGKKELAVKLWYVLMFQMWYERWFNK
jgi:asparagine synthase (glutamine-hydrolysing)